MQKLTTYLNLALFTGLCASTAANAYIAVPPSIFQDEDNTIYLSIGGGVASERSGDWSGSEHHAGLNAPSQDKSTVPMGTAAIGYGFKNYPFRIEAAYNFIGIAKFKWDSLDPPVTTGKTESAEAKVYSNLGLLNLYGDLPIGDNWIPFIKIGAGYGMNEAKFSYTDEATGDVFTSDNHSNNNFVWNAGVGVNYAMSESVSIGAEVTYLYLGKAYVDASVVPVAGGEEINQSFAELDKLTAVAATLNIAYHF
jgi:opacity protein-like surface antigen